MIVVPTNDKRVKNSGVGAKSAAYSSTPQLLNSSTPQLLNSSTPQLPNSRTPELLNSRTPVGAAGALSAYSPRSQIGSIGVLKSDQPQPSYDQ